jgi:hypothetical protein
MVFENRGKKIRNLYPQVKLYSNTIAVFSLLEQILRILKVIFYNYSRYRLKIFQTRSIVNENTTAWTYKKRFDTHLA